MQNFNSLTLADTASLCQGGGFSSSALPEGLWFSYIPSESSLLRILVETSAEGSSSIPNMLSLKGTCESLTCDPDGYDTIAFEDGQAGTQYYIYVFRNSADAGYSPWKLTLEYISPPSNDKMETAVAITDQDLPFDDQFSTYGATSDASQDACGLAGQYGIWFSYTTTALEQPLILEITVGVLQDSIGIQYQLADGSFACVGTALSTGSSIEWTAQGNTPYYILVGVAAPEDGHVFGLTLQSSSVTTPPTSPLTVSPVSPTLAPTSAVAATAATSTPQPSSSTATGGLSSLAPTIQPISNEAANTPTNIPTGLNANPSTTDSLSGSDSSSESLSSPFDRVGTQLFLATIMLFFFL